GGGVSSLAAGCINRGRLGRARTTLADKQQSGYSDYKAQYEYDVAIHNSSPGKLIQPGQMAGKQGKATGQDQHAEQHQEYAARDFQCMQMPAKAPVETQEAVDQQ